MEVPRDKLDLRDDEKVLSAPTLDAVWKCGKAVVVRGFVAHATLDVEVAGAVVVSGFNGGFPNPNGALIPLPSKLSAGDVVRARQTFNGVTSPWSAPRTAQDHTVEFPAGPPRPEISPAPVYKCGRRTGVGNLLVGSDVWIEADAVEVGRVEGAQSHQGVNVSPSYGLGQNVIAFTQLCKDVGPPSATVVSQAGPSPMPTLGFQPVYNGSEQCVITGVVTGATITLSRNGIVQFSFPSFGTTHTVGLTPPLSSGETLSATQVLCKGDTPSNPGDTTVLPCSALPAPEVEPIQTGATSVTCTTFAPDAEIKVFVNGVKRGDGSGPVITLSSAVKAGDTVDVWQIVGTCKGKTVQELTVQCVAPPIGADPSHRNLFPVGTTTYDGGTTTVPSGHSHKIAGTIYYPANADGAGTPFNERLAKLGRVPIAVLVHGRHGGSTSHLGYDYLQQQLAQMGIIAASVDCNESDQWGGWTDNILDRADLVIKSIAHLQGLDSGGDPIFGGRIDFDRLAMMGHSRGGDAVVTVPEIISLAGVTIRGVISLGPVNSGASSGHPKGYPLLAILPASDGDVVDNNGAQFYDGADPSPFKGQLYVDHANHNYFNRQWLNDDTGGGLPIMARADHERILSTYGCAFFRNVLLGHSTLGYLEGTVRPPAVLTQNVHLSFKKAKQVTVDDHEDGNTIAKNSMNAPTTQSGGLTADEHEFAQGAATAFNASFFGATIGMVAQHKKRSGNFRSELDKARDLRKSQVWIRSAEVYDGASVPAGATGFKLGLEDKAGNVAWVDSDGVGGVPRPLDRKAFDLGRGGPDKTKTMPNTLRFPIACFTPPKGKEFNARSVVAVWLRLDRPDGRALAFDDLQFVR